MSETSLDRIITETEFAELLSQEARAFFQLSNSLQHASAPELNRKYLYQLTIEADNVEVLLDDHGARQNRSFLFFRELVASIRGFARAGFALAHLDYRFEGYSTSLRSVVQAPELAAFRDSLAEALGFIRGAVDALLAAAHEEAHLNGVQWCSQSPRFVAAPSTSSCRATSTRTFTKRRACALARSRASTSRCARCSRA